MAEETELVHTNNSYVMKNCIAAFDPKGKIRDLVLVFWKHPGLLSHLSEWRAQITTNHWRDACFWRQWIVFLSHIYPTLYAIVTFHCLDFHGFRKTWISVGLQLGTTGLCRKAILSLHLFAERRRRTGGGFLYCSVWDTSKTHCTEIVLSSLLDISQV